MLKRIQPDVFVGPSESYADDLHVLMSQLIVTVLGFGRIAAVEAMSSGGSCNGGNSSMNRPGYSVDGYKSVLSLNPVGRSPFLPLHLQSRESPSSSP